MQLKREHMELNAKSRRYMVNSSQKKNKVKMTKQSYSRRELSKQQVGVRRASSNEDRARVDQHGQEQYMKQRSTGRGWGRKGDKQKALTGDQDGCWGQEKREAPEGQRMLSPC